MVTSVITAFKLKNANRRVREVIHISTYEEFMIIIGVANLVIGILSIKKGK